MGAFEVGTVSVVFAIFGLFYWGAFKAEKVVNEKAKKLRESQSNLGGTISLKKAKIAPKDNNPKK